jgi:shikimate kinase/3-dehydroquinate synthase
VRSIVLSGFMGTGKSTVGPRLARARGVPFIDTDETIAAEVGMTVAELWQRDGERSFRAREQALARRLLDDPAPRVIAFGGGTVTDRATRHLALDRATLITLTALPETIAARVGDAAARPNLSSAAGGEDAPGAHSRKLARVAELLDQRGAAYAEAHASIATDALAPDAVAEECLAVADREPLVMPLGLRSYAVELPPAGEGPGAVAAVVERLAPSRVIVVTDAHVSHARGGALEDCIRLIRAPTSTVTLEAGENAKTLASVSSIWDAALHAGIDRRAVVLAFGGGVVGDMAGFAASTLLRGLRVVQVPTTLLAMVDASVGGKTGFDHAVGKNLIGTFHQPDAVVVDLEHLTTLPGREVRAGLAEVVKVGLVADGALLAALEGVVADVAAGRWQALAPIVRAAIAAKIRVVRDDERESGARALLNLGHTVGHALEAHGQYSRYLHGEAVAIGTLVELEVGAALGATPRDLVERTRALLLALGLSTSLDASELAAAWPFVHADKKRDGSDLRLPVVRAAGVATVERVSLELAQKTLLAPH